MEEVSCAGVALFFIDARGTCREDATFRAVQFIWADLGTDDAEKLKGQLVALLGEPTAEMLLDDQACKKLNEATGMYGVVVEHE